MESVLPVVKQEDPSKQSREQCSEKNKVTSYLCLINFSPSINWWKLAFVEVWSEQYTLLMARGLGEDLTMACQPGSLGEHHLSQNPLQSVWRIGFNI